ncbi:type I polyketide synthase [Microbispora hainanensis]|nr:type I polyketide synthase [Microbispora hainanensis]
MPRTYENAPIAIVGMGIRFPGGNDEPAGFQRFLREGRSAIGPLPEGRLPGLPEDVTAAGGYLDSIEGFDAGFFNISPKEAAWVDPQHRLTLETAWEALEDAGIDPTSLRHGDTGVYVAVTGMDYAMEIARLPVDQVELYAGTGMFHCGASGRISYFLGLRGPSMSVDGAAVIALKRLADARRDGDRVLAVIRGSAVRQDGESAALMAPNGEAQALLMRAALDDAGLDAADIQYVEAHGTGTALGDPIEMSGIAEVFSASHTKDNPVLVGSVKTNFGHLESTAGLAGLVKTVLQLRDRTVYPHINFTTPSRKIPWERIPVRVPVTATPWEAAGARLALVNSYGATGTIASVVLEEADEREPAPEARDRESGPVPGIFTLSAKSARSLQLQLDAYAAFMADRTDDEVADICRTTNVGRAHHLWRVSAPVTTAAELVDFIDRRRARPAGPRPSAGRKNIALMFAGGGSQYAGMGLSLYRRFPVFREHLDRCDELFAPLVDSVRDDILTDGPPDREQVESATVLTARLFSLEYALARLWLSLGVRPGVLLGHSLGEIVAAAVSGVLTLEDAVRLVSARGTLLDRTSAGSMAAVDASREEVLPFLAGRPDASLGAVNGPTQCVISGAGRSVAEVASLLEARGVKVKLLRVPCASHSPLMDEIAEEYRAVLDGIRFGEPEFPIASAVLGRMAANGEMSTPEFWLRHLRSTVNFADAVRAVEERGRHIFLEVGPGAELLGMGRECVTDDGHLWLGSLHRGDLSGETMRLTVSRLYNAGVPISWTAWHEGTAGARVSLPKYAFDRKPYWLPAPADTGASPDPAEYHPLLGREAPPTPSPAGTEAVFVSRINASRPSYLAEHDLNGTSVFPGTGFVEMLFAVQDALFGETIRPVEDLAFHEPLFLSAEFVSVRTRVRAEPDGTRQVEISSLLGPAEASVERVHVTARIGHAADLAVVRPDIPAGEAGLTLSRDELSAYYRDHGARYGPTFQTLERAVRYGEDGDGTTVVGQIHGRRPASSDFLHPALLAGALQSAAALFADRRTEGFAYVLVSAERARLLRKPRGTSLRSVLRVIAREEQRVGADLTLLDEEGAVVFAMSGLSFRRVSVAGPRPVGAGGPIDTNRTTGATPAIDAAAWNELDEPRRTEIARAFLLSRVAELLCFDDPGDIPENASFFELGMDSLIAVKLKSAAETAFRVPLEARTLFENATVEALATALAAKAPSAPSTERV